MGARGQRRERFVLLDSHHNESRMFGVDSLTRDLVAAAEVPDANAAGFADGTFQPPAIDRILPLEADPDTCRRVAEGAPGRVVLAPG